MVFLIFLLDNPTIYLGYLKGNSSTANIWCSPASPIIFRKKLNDYDIIPWQFPDLGQMAKIPWQFHDLVKILFLSNFLNQRDQMSNASET